VAETILAKMAVLISANSAELKKALSSTSNDLKSFQGNVMKLAGAVGIAFGVKEIATFGFEISKLAGEAKGVESAFNRLPNSEQLMKRLKEATHDTVSEMDLMKRSVQSANFGISLEALPKLLEFASLRAQQTGQSVDYLVDSIVTGIGRKSPLILDNLGISAVQLKKQLNGVSMEAASIGQVAEAVGRIASDNLAQMGEYSENTASAVQKLNAEWVNFKVRMGEAANSSTVLDTVLNKLAKTLKILGQDAQAQADVLTKGFLEAVKGNSINVDQFVEQLKVLRRESGKPLEFNATELINQFDLTGDQADLLINKILEINNTLSDQERRIKIFKDFARGYEDVNKAAEDFKNIQYQNILNQQIQKAELEKYTPELVEEINQTKIKIKVYRDLITAVNDYVKANQQITVQPQTEQLGLLETLEAKLKTLEEARKNAFNANAIATFNDEIRKTREEIDLLLAGTNSLSSFGKQQETNADAGKETTFTDFSAGDPSSPTDKDAAMLGSSLFPDITDQVEAYIDNINRAAEAEKGIADQRTIYNEDTLRQLDQIGSAIGDSLAAAVNGEESFLKSIKRSTIGIVKEFAIQALAAAFSKGVKETPGPPPVGLAVATAAVGVVAAFFSRLGSGGGGAGAKGSSSASRPVTHAERFVSADGQRVQLSGEFKFDGYSLRAQIEQTENRSNRLG
jgi:hypothetical protein